MDNLARKITVIPGNLELVRRQTRPQKLRVAAYCRVSTDDEEQLTSYENQIAAYTQKISENPDWTLAGIFPDEGLTGTSTKKREQFNKMMALCKRGKIDLILTKIHLPLCPEHPGLPRLCAQAQVDGRRRLLRAGEHQHAEYE